MRILRLALLRYGHLADVTLDFLPEAGLHVVLGANEAGKSTALAALGDCLFRFRKDTDFAFLHAMPDLRVGITLQAAEGRTASFVRRKGKVGDLLDMQDQPLPESAIAAFLGGTTRARFDNMFGLNAAALRSGGAAILSDKGELGETLVAAQTGLHGFGTLAEAMDKEAAKLFGDRRGQRALHTVVDQFKAAQAELGQRSIPPARYAETHATLEALRAADAAHADEAARIAAERARLDRIRRTAPGLRERAAALQRRADLGTVKLLPADAAAQYQDAAGVIAQSAHDLQREHARAAGLRDEIGTLAIDPGLLAEAEAIDRLAADLSRITKAHADRAELRIAAEQHRRLVEAAAARLGLAGDADAVGARIPNALARDAAARALDGHVKLTSRHEDTTRAHHEALLAHDEALLAATALADPAPFATLRAAIEAAKAEGPIDSQRVEAMAALQAARADCARRLDALPHWSGTADALARMALPLEPEAVAAGEAVMAAETALQDCTKDLVEQDRHAAGIARALAEITEAGEVPTEAAIAEARTRRDAAWQALRDHWTGDTADQALPGRFESLLHEADALADRRATEAERVALFEETCRNQRRTQAERDLAAAALAAARTARDLTRQRWDALWQPSKIPAPEPAGRAEWLRRRSDVLASDDLAHKAARALDLIDARYRAAWDALATLLPDPAPDTQGRLATLLRAAEALCAERERAADAHKQTRMAIETAAKALAKSTKILQGIETDLAEWQATWTAAAAGLHLPPGTPPEQAKLALDLWTQVDLANTTWTEHRNRIAQMTQAIKAAKDEAARIAGAVAPDLADVTMAEAVRSLAARLAATRAAERERSRLQRDLAELMDTIGGIEAEQTAAESTLGMLRALAGAPDDDTLQAAIHRAADFLKISDQIARLETDLYAQADGWPLDALAAEAEDMHLDTLPADIAAIEARQNDIAEARRADAGKLTALHADLAAMEAGQDAARSAQAMQNALGTIEDLAARYVRLHLAKTLLRAGIDGFRRQLQAPLLGRAGSLFARLTEGRYARLAADPSEDGNTLMLVALQPDGRRCPAERLSEGTRDQLYLALRLAAIESYAAHAEPLPFIADDLLVNFDDRRAAAALRVLVAFGATTQTILFTHHAHIAELAQQAGARLQHLPAEAAAPARSMKPNLVDHAALQT